MIDSGFVPVDSVNITEGARPPNRVRRPKNRPEHSPPTHEPSASFHSRIASALLWTPSLTYAEFM